jgi:renalase
MKRGDGNRPRVAVVGAGIAGLACARALMQAGYQVIVYEKSRGAAGRMSTRRSEDDGHAWQCDHGAQYFTARDADFRAEVSRWQHAGAAAVWKPRLAVLGGSGGRAAGTASAGGTASGESVATERFVGTPGMTAPARLLTDELDVRPTTTIQRLVRVVAAPDFPHQWRLCSAEYGELTDVFDAVMLAVPAPQALALLDAAATLSFGTGGVNVSVGADLRAAATAVVMRPCWALMARFEQSVALPFDAAFVNQGPLRWLARDSSKPGRVGPETWSLHATAEWSQAHVQSTPDDAMDTLLAAFGALGGSVPFACTAHRWLYADSARALQQGCVYSAEDRLGLCGDWLAGGRVEGAWLSGRALARRLDGVLAAKL